MSRHAGPAFRAVGTALLRAAAWPHLELPEWAPLADPAADDVVRWLRRVWAFDESAEALTHASPVLAQRVHTLCSASSPSAREARRVALSVARYLRRLEGRPTPFGLFAGVAPVTFGGPLSVRWGTRHRVVARAGAAWLAEVVARLEERSDLLVRLQVVTNSTLMVRGDRLIVPYRSHTRQRGTGAVDVSLRYTAPVRAAVEAAKEPVRVEDLEAKLRVEFPAAASEAVSAMVRTLVARGALITSLHAPSTEPDALGHLLEQLAAAGAAEVSSVSALVEPLRAIHAALEEHNRAPAGEGRANRAVVAERMHRADPTGPHPLAVDLRLDAQVVLPRAVVREVEHAALTLTRLSRYPVGTPAWKKYHQRFYEKYGIGSMVPLLDVVAGSGIGWPDGYPGTVTPEKGSPVSSRDEVLLALAQEAALEGREEVILNEALIEALQLGSERLRPPSHLEVGVRVHAADHPSLRRGDFQVEVVTVSRAAGVLVGRFLSVVESEHRERLSADLANLPGGDGDTVAAQLSFPPLDATAAHVTRTPRVLPRVVSLSEHRGPQERVLTAADLAVGCDGRRLYLAAPGSGQRLEAAGLHALNLKTHTPPLARLLTELGRAQCAQVTVFDWGAAARLPFLPRVRVGRTVLSPARWRLSASELPASSDSQASWEDALASWRERRRVPRWVHLVDGDRHLPLDLDHPGHRVLLRTHTRSASNITVAEAPTPEDLGWCGGRPHEVIVPMSATEPPRWPPLPRPTQARIIAKNRTQTPATSDVLLASLYGDLRRQDVILTQYLPDLLSRFEHPPQWWYVRYRDPDNHLRLRFQLPHQDTFGEFARTVSTWAEEVRDLGLLSDLQYPTSQPETGRWGSDAAWEAAQVVFRADSQALLVQLGLPARPPRRALVAAHTVAIAVDFTGSTAHGMRWLIDHIPAAAPTAIPRPLLDQARRIADPHADWTALRAEPGGAEIVEAWQPRQRALAAYRDQFPGPDTEGIAVDDVVGSLLHVNFVRACGIDFDDEAVGLYLARAAALSWTARAREGRR